MAINAVEREGKESADGPRRDGDSGQRRLHPKNTQVSSLSYFLDLHFCLFLDLHFLDLQSSLASPRQTH